MRRAKVQLISDEDPHVFDYDTGQDVTDRCVKVEFLPGQRCIMLYKDNEGKVVVDGETKDRIITEVWPVVEIVGHWKHRLAG